VQFGRGLPVRVAGRSARRRWRLGQAGSSFWFDGVLAEQGAEPVDLAAECLALVGQGRRGGVRDRPFVLAVGLGGEQVLSLVTQRRGPFIVVGLDGGFLRLSASAISRSDPLASCSRRTDP